MACQHQAAPPLVENPRKRRRGEISSLLVDPDDAALTQSKTTRRQMDIDAQIMFLSQEMLVQLKKPQRSKDSQREPYPFIIRRVKKSIDE